MASNMDLLDKARQLAQAGSAHLDNAHDELHGLIEESPENNEAKEAFYAAVVAFAVIVLSRAPSASARLRVQLLAHELCRMHEIDLGDDVLHDLQKQQIAAIKEDNHDYPAVLELIGLTKGLEDNDA